MVEKSKKSTQARAKVAHKLAKYVRANAVHVPSKLSAQLPSVSHLTYGGAGVRKWRNNQNTWYSAEDEKARHPDHKSHPKAPVPRKSVQPGNVAILLAGKHRGRRVVVLKVLNSGNLLVTGPYSINGVPLRRVNPAYVLNTSTKVSLEGVNANIDDSFFKKQKKFTGADLKKASEAGTKKVEEAKEMATKWREEAKNVQKAVDGKLLHNIKAVEHLTAYLGTRFTLYANSRPHEMKF